MKHFWLSDTQQAVMDTATSSAQQFHSVAALNLGKSWKKQLKDQSGFKVADDAYLRTYNVVRTPGLRFDSLVRLTAAQSTLMKLRYAGTDDGIVQADPTGEIWGNMLVSVQDQADRNYLTGFRGGTYRVFEEYCAGNGYGPTIATVGNSCAGLPVNWGHRLVWWQLSQWHDASLPADDVFNPPEEYRDSFDELFEQPLPTYGQSWARQFWARCQDANFRRAFTIPDASSETL